MSFIFGLLVISGVAHGQDIGWLKEICVRDQGFEAVMIPSPVPNLTTLKDAREYQSKVLDDWSCFLGCFDLPPTRVAPLYEILEQSELPRNLLRKLVRYETEPGQFVEAYILAPSDTTRRRPGAVVFHSTVQHSIQQCVGLADPRKGTEPSADELRKAYALHLAERGFVTVSPRNFLWTDNLHLDAAGQAKAFSERHPHRLGMARMLFDSVRAVDLLVSLPGVDAARIGAVGHSLGAKEVLYLAAFDPRIQAAVSSEGGVGIKQSNWEAPWYLGDGSKANGFPRDHHQLVAAIAPRPFLLIGGDASDGVASLPYLKEAEKVYRLFSSNPRMGLFNHKQGHIVTPESLDRTIDWLTHYLATPH